MDEFREDFKQSALVDAKRVENQITHTIAMLYQGLRTIARLPGAKNIDRYARNLDSDSRATIQELYNTLYTNISLSKVYLTPADFDPESIDSNTNSLSEPIVTFDEFIIGQHAEKHPNIENISQIEEIEIYEYRLMQKQIAWMKKHHPVEATISGLAYPAISGAEVVTRDNSYFSPSKPNDADRSGIVYSVPFYGPNGNLKGLVSGVVLTRFLKQILPNGNYALINKTNNYFIVPAVDGTWHQSLPHIRAARVDTSLLYSGLLDISIVDSTNWQLWVGRPIAEFENNNKVIAHQRTSLIATIAVILFVVGMHIILLQQRRQSLFILNQKKLLEEKVQERTQALSIANKSLIKANSAKANFLSRVSHELRTPLNAIIGYSELILDEDSLTSPESEKDITRIHGSGKHLLSLINEVLDISKIESGKMEINTEEIKIVDLLEETIEVLTPAINKNGNKIGINIATKFDSITSDKIKVKQILLNLLSNANKFTDKGRITIDISSTLNEEVEWIILKISDTGIGISAEKIDHIFEEFFQAHNDANSNTVGTGLGLSICSKFADLLQGTITVASTLHKGTTFTFSVPRINDYCLVPEQQSVA